MPSALDNLPSGSRVAVIRIRSLGDCVLTTPALEILKNTRPDLIISVAVEERFTSVFEGNPDVAEILPPTVNAVARFRPTLTINLHGGTRSMVLTAASGARLRAGFEHFRGSSMYNIRIPRAQVILNEERTVHTAEHLASAMFYLGAARQPIPRAKLFASRRSKPALPLAVIHPFASAPGKTWPAQSFLAVAEHLNRNGLEPVFLAGPTDEASAFSRYRTVAGAHLHDVKNLLSGATVFAGNDSGPAHMAAAFGIPVVVLFGASNPVVWAPWQVPSQVLVSEGPIESIQPIEVIEALEYLRVPR
jgi:ADP-heptose:LPS heptosyltransferase